MTSNPSDLLQKCRHPGRLRASQLLARIAPDFAPTVSPDAALICGVGTLGGAQVSIFAQEKPQGRDPRKAVDVNYGMMSATGYWFVVEQLEKLPHNRPVLFLVDTPGADPSKRGAENLLAWSVSAAIRALLKFPGPTLSVVLGEGGSGGALAMQVADHRLMVSDAIYATMSPESCSAILYHNATQIDEALRIMRPTAPDILRIGMVDEVVPMGENQMIEQHDAAARALGQRITAGFAALSRLPSAQRLKRRHSAYLSCGRSQQSSHVSAAPRRAPSMDLAPPPMLKFSVLSQNSDEMAAIRSAYYSSKHKEAPSAEESDMVCPRDRGGCGVLFSQQAYLLAAWSCPSCGRGERLDSEHWLQVLCGDASFEELYADLDLSDLDHGGYDNAEYRAQRAAVKHKTGLTESLRVGVGEIDGIRAALAISDFRFFGGTLGAVAGEKLALIAQRAREEHLPLVTVTCSGGVRMQDGTLGLAQMAKTVVAMEGVMAAGLSCVSVLADPCTGGALGSYATAANAVLAEPSALVAFAGPRVMRLGGLPVNEAATLSNRFVEYGGVDEVVPRNRMRWRVWRYMQLKPTQMHRNANRAAEPASAAARLNDMNYWFDELVMRSSAVLQDYQTSGEIATNSVNIQASVVARLGDLALITIPLLLEQASNSANPRVRANALESLSRFPAHDRAQLFAGLNDDHHRVRANAALSLLRQDPSTPEALSVLKRLMMSEEAVHRRAALFALTRTPVEALRSLVQQACEDKDDLVRVCAFITLFSYGEDRMAAPRLQEHLEKMGSAGERTVKRMLQFMPEDAARLLRDTVDGQ